jgi:hypothetical protein
LLKKLHWDRSLPPFDQHPLVIAMRSQRGNPVGTLILRGFAQRAHADYLDVDVVPSRAGLYKTVTTAHSWAIRTNLYFEEPAGFGAARASTRQELTAYCAYTREKAPSGR